MLIPRLVCNDSPPPLRVDAHSCTIQSSLFGGSCGIKPITPSPATALALLPFPVLFQPSQFSAGVVASIVQGLNPNHKHRSSRVMVLKPQFHLSSADGIAAHCAVCLKPTGLPNQRTIMTHSNRWILTAVSLFGFIFTSCGQLGTPSQSPSPSFGANDPRSLTALGLVQSVGSGQTVFTPTGGMDYRYGPAFIRNADDSIDMWTCSPGANGQWDYIRYARSVDDGYSFPNEQIVLQPTTTTGSRDYQSVCDPGVVKFGGYYYLAYTGIAQPTDPASPLVGNPNHVFVARSTSPSGPFDKWNGSGWGGLPQPFITYNGPADVYGIGEPSLVVKGGTLYIYYSEYTNTTNKTLVATASTSGNWPGAVTLRGTAIDRSDSGIGIGADIQDTTDHKYVPSLDKFIAVGFAKRLTADSYIQLYESADGLTFTPSGQITQGLQAFGHNIGLTGDELGQFNPTEHNYIGYAYGPNWGEWSTYVQPLILSNDSNATLVDKDNSVGTFTNYVDISAQISRVQPFGVTGTTLSQIKIWTYRAGSPSGALEVRIYAMNGSNQPIGLPLSTHIIPSVPTTPGWITLNPGLTNLTRGGTYGFVLSSPLSTGGPSDAYGWAYNDSNLYPSYAESYTTNGGSSWNLEAARSLKFITYASSSADTDASVGPFSEYEDVHATVQRLQTFTVSSSTLSRFDIWTRRPSSNAGDLTLKIYAVNALDNPIGPALWTSTLNPSIIPAAFGWLYSYPNLTGLTVGGKYAFILTSPTSSGSYGWAYRDDNPIASGLERYSTDGGATWTTEAARDLKFIAYR